LPVADLFLRIKGRFCRAFALDESSMFDFEALGCFFLFSFQVSFGPALTNVRGAGLDDLHLFSCPS